MENQDLEPEVIMRKVDDGRYNPFLDKELSEYLKLDERGSCKQFDLASGWITILRNSPGMFVKAGETLHFKYPEDVIHDPSGMEAVKKRILSLAQSEGHSEAESRHLGASVTSKLVAIHSGNDSDTFAPASSPHPQGKMYDHANMRSVINFHFQIV
jgi:hypothetical protein